MSQNRFKTTAYNRRTQEREPVTLDIEIDWVSLARRLATKALNNKTGKTVMLNGIIQAVIVGKAKAGR